MYDKQEKSPILHMYYEELQKGNVLTCSIIWLNEVGQKCVFNNE